MIAYVYYVSLLKKAEQKVGPGVIRKPVSVKIAETCKTYPNYCNLGAEIMNVKFRLSILTR